MKNILTAILLFAVCTATGLAQDKVYRYEKGKDYKYLLEETNMTIQEVQGQSMTSNTESTVSSVISIKDVNEAGNMTATVTIENALILVENDNGTQSYGNDFTGKFISYTFDHLGDVVDVDTNTTKLLEGPAASTLSRMSDLLPKLDASKLSVGSSWNTSKVDTSAQGENSTIVETETKYSVLGKKQVKGFDCLEISITVESEINGTMVRGDQEMSISGTREMKGTIHYAVAEGVLVAMNADTTSDQVVVLAAMNMRVPITSTSNLKVELVTK